MGAPQKTKMLYRLLRAAPLFLGLCIAFTCPDYADIRQPSVDQDKFDIEEFAGEWFMLATTEPTMPSFCVCGVNNVTVDKPAMAYSYTNTDDCLGKKVTLHIKGDLSTDITSPGLLHENAALFNHTIGKLDPNMVFHVEVSHGNCGDGVCLIVLVQRNDAGKI